MEEVSVEEVSVEHCFFFFFLFFLFAATTTTTHSNPPTTPSPSTAAWDKKAFQCLHSLTVPIAASDWWWHGVLVVIGTHGGLAVSLGGVPTKAANIVSVLPIRADWVPSRARVGQWPWQARPFALTSNRGQPYPSTRVDGRQGMREDLFADDPTERGYLS